MTTKHIISAKLPTLWGEFDLHGFLEEKNNKEHVVLSMGSLKNEEAPLVRIHSECLTGDALFSLRCDCGPQLKLAMKIIAEQGCGAIVYLRQEGRGIGLLNKIKAYQLQDQGADTVEANEQLGFNADLRNYDICKDILTYLGIKRLRLMTNNPKKVAALEKLGFEVSERVPHLNGQNPHNKKYLQTKQDKLGHWIKNQD